MTPPNDSSFHMSYRRALQTKIEGASFIDSFYSLFLSRSEHAATLFAGIDLIKQKSMILVALALVINPDVVESGPDNELLTGFAIIHQRLGVGSDLYEIWVNSMLETVKLYDSQYNSEVETAWKVALQVGVEFMLDPDNNSEIQ